MNWCDMGVDCNPLLYIHGVPGAGRQNRFFIVKTQ